MYGAADISGGGANILRGAADILRGTAGILRGEPDILHVQQNFVKCFGFSKKILHFFNLSLLRNKINITKYENLSFPEFEFYEWENYFFVTIYPYMVIFLQGTAIICSILFNFTDYRKWNMLFTILAGCCLPVDVLIFYKEPFGSIGTLIIMVAAFVPYMVMVADAMFPEKEMFVYSKGRKNYTIFNGG